MKLRKEIGISIGGKMINTKELIGAVVTDTFIDRGSNLVIKFQNSVPVGVEPNWRTEEITREIRIKPDGFHHLTIGADDGGN